MAKQTTKLRRKITAAQILRNIFSCSLISFYLLPICFCVAVLSLSHLWNTLAGEMNSDETVLVIFQKVFKKFRYQTQTLYCYVLQGFNLHLSTESSMLVSLFGDVILWGVSVVLSDSIVLLLSDRFNHIMRSLFKIHSVGLGEVFLIHEEDGKGMCRNMYKEYISSTYRARWRATRQVESC